MTTIYRIAPSGGDYSQPQTAYDAHVGAFTGKIFEIERGYYDGLSATGHGGASATDYFHLRAADGHKFRGILDAVSSYGEGAYPHLAWIDCEDDYSRFEHLGCTGGGYHGGWYHGIRLAADNCLVDSCGIDGIAEVLEIAGILVASGSGNVIRNNVIANLEMQLFGASNDLVGILLDAGNALNHVYANAISRLRITNSNNARNVYGIHAIASFGSAAIVRNNAIGYLNTIGTGAAQTVKLTNAAGIDCDYNAVSDDAADAGTHRQSNLAPTTEWGANHATDDARDFHIAASSTKLRGNAGTWSGYANAPTEDVDDEPVGTDIGPDTFSLVAEYLAWTQPLAEPVLPRPPSPEGVTALGAEPSLWPTPETITVEKWAQPLAEPVLPRPPTPDTTQFLGAEPSLWPAEETITVDKWAQPLALPVLPRPPAPSGEPWRGVDPSLFTTGETVTLDKWWQPLAEPIAPQRPAPELYGVGAEPPAPILAAVATVTYYVDARGVFRIFNEAVYRFYRELAPADPPEEGDTPWATSAALPATPTDTFADGTWRLSLSYFNGVYDSGFYEVGPGGRTWHTIVVIGGAAYNPPPGPTDWYLEERGGGVVRVVGHVHAGGDEAPDEWSIGYTTDGSDPAEDTPDATEAVAVGAVFGSAAATLQYDLPAQADATEVRVRLQTRRQEGAAWVYSDDSEVQSLTVAVAAIDAPADAATWPGTLDA